MRILKFITVLLLCSVISAGCSRTYDEKLKMLAVSSSGEIWIMNTDGTDQSALTSTPTDGTCTEASWSPDCDTVVYKSYQSPTYSLCLMDSSGNNKRVLYSSASDIINSTFFPDGKRIAFGEGSVVYECNTKTGVISTLYTASGTICFLSISGSGDISVLHGSGWDVYTPSGGWQSYSATSNFSLTYSPDGASLAYIYTGTNKLMVVTADSTSISGTGTLIADAYSDAGPAWEPSGKYIYYYYTGTGICRICPDGTGYECIISGTTFTKPQIQGKPR